MRSLLPTGLPDHPGWRRLFAAYATSKFGGEFTKIALFARTYDLGGDVSTLAFVGIAQAVPMLLISPISGALADRMSRKRLAIWADLVRAACLLIIATVDDLWVLVGATVVVASGTALFGPAEGALEADLVPDEDIVRVSAVRAGTKNVLMLLGPAAAGVMLAATTSAVALGLDAVTFLVSAGLLWGVPEPMTAAEPEPAAQGLLRSVAVGWHAVWSRPVLRVLLITQTLVVLVLGAQGPLLYEFTLKVLGSGPETFAMLMTCLGLGALLGTVVMWRRPNLRDHGPRLIMAVLIIDGVALGLFSGVGSLLVCMVTMVVMGLISAVFWIVVRGVLQTAPPAQLRGRVLGLFGALVAPIELLALSAVPLVIPQWTAAQILGALAIAEVALGGVFLVQSTLGRSEELP